MLAIFSAIKKKLGDDEFRQPSKPISINVTRRKYFKIEDLVNALNNSELKSLRSAFRSDLITGRGEFSKGNPGILQNEFISDIREVLKNEEFLKGIMAYNVYIIEYDGKKYKFFDSKEDVEFRDLIATNQGGYIYVDPDSRKVVDKIKDDPRILDCQNRVVEEMRNICETQGIRGLYSI
jgi:hypothetical protein